MFQGEKYREGDQRNDTKLAQVSGTHDSAIILRMEFAPVDSDIL
jgi:hypothetical protein